MKYCTRCLYPETKPDLFFDKKGVCSACIAFEARSSINWEERAAQFKKLVFDIKLQNNIYDCIVPVSGGKDSHYQTLKVKEYGLNPLLVYARTDHITDIGRRNLDNLNSYADVCEFSPSVSIRRRISAYTLKTVGDISWPEHITIFSIPYRASVIYNIPLIVWGENPQNEYGGPATAQKAINLDERWLSEYGGLNGLRISDVQRQLNLSLQDIEMYKFPKTDKPVQGLFLGQFFPWDGANNATIAVKNGFECWYGPVEGSGYAYENLDNYQTGVHDYYKYLKFGFGRCTDIVSNHIRRGNISRRDAIEHCKLYDGKYPNTYLGKPLFEILEPLNITIEEFLEVCNKFANKELFECKKGRVPRPKFRIE